MKKNFFIKEIKSPVEMLEQFQLIKQLNFNLKKSEYKIMLNDMIFHGYRMVGVFENSKCTGLGGFWISTKIYSGKYVELDNIVIDKNNRSKGIGKILCNWIEKEAKRLGCKTAMLDAYAENQSAHRFYFREGYVIRGFHFLKKL